MCAYAENDFIIMVRVFKNVYQPIEQVVFQSLIYNVYAMAVDVHCRKPMKGSNSWKLNVS